MVYSSPRRAEGYLRTGESPLRIETIAASQAPAALLNHNAGRRAEHWDQLAEASQSAKVGDWLRVLLTDINDRLNAIADRLEAAATKIIAAKSKAAK